jgi:adenine phosphoribosyltransferase
MMTEASVEAIKASIRTIPDFPTAGIQFRDITPLLLDKDKFRFCVDYFASITGGDVDCVISIESRGFILGSALAYALGVGFVPIRKAGKLPHKTHSASYGLEYGTATVEIHVDALKEGARVVIVDDVLATGGTAEAAVCLIKKFNGSIAGLYVLIELAALKGRERLGDLPVRSLVTY